MLRTRIRHAPFHDRLGEIGAVIDETRASKHDNSGVDGPAGACGSYLGEHRSRCQKDRHHLQADSELIRSKQRTKRVLAISEEGMVYTAQGLPEPSAPFARCLPSRHT